MDPDIVADPDDMAGLHRGIASDPMAVWASMHKLWPASTGRDSWAWAFGRHDGQLPVMTQDAEPPYGWFALGLTYLPAVLLNLAVPDMPLWEFGQIDVGLSAKARQHGVPINVAGLCRPKHLHFDRAAADRRPGRHARMQSVTVVTGECGHQLGAVTDNGLPAALWCDTCGGYSATVTSDESTV